MGAFSGKDTVIFIIAYQFEKGKNLPPSEQG